MRTTISIDDDILADARGYASRRGLPLGRAITELIQKGLESECPIVMKEGIAVLSPGPGAPRVTSEQVYEVLEEWP